MTRCTHVVQSTRMPCRYDALWSGLCAYHYAVEQKLITEGEQHVAEREVFTLPMRGQRRRG